MPVEAVLFLVVGVAYFAVVITALLINGIWVAPFIERHGQRAAGFVSYWFMGTGLVIDYIHARRLCRALSVKPPWMRWFSALFWIWAASVAGVLAVLLIVFSVKILSGRFG